MFPFLLLFFLRITSVILWLLEFDCCCFCSIIIYSQRVTTEMFLQEIKIETIPHILEKEQLTSTYGNDTWIGLLYSTKTSRLSKIRTKMVLPDVCLFDKLSKLHVFTCFGSHSLKHEAYESATWCKSVKPETRSVGFMKSLLFVFWQQFANLFPLTVDFTEYFG